MSDQENSNPTELYLVLIGLLSQISNDQAQAQVDPKTLTKILWLFGVLVQGRKLEVELRLLATFSEAQQMLCQGSYWAVINELEQVVAARPDRCDPSGLRDLLQAQVDIIKDVLKKPVGKTDKAERWACTNGALVIITAVSEAFLRAQLWQLQYPD